MSLSWFSPTRRLDRFLTRAIASDNLLYGKVQHMTTPAAIDRITAHAERASTLMKDTDKAGEKAESVLNAYELSLDRFTSGIDAVDEKRKALDAALPAMGNAATVLDQAFQDEKTVAAKSSNGVEQQTIKSEDTGKVEEVLRAPHPMPPATP